MSVVNAPHSDRLTVVDQRGAQQLPAPVADPPALSDEARELLTWVARQPRTYAEAMAVWQTSCPRHSVWEDVMAGALIEVANGRGTPMEQAAVCLTAAGRTALGGA